MPMKKENNEIQLCDDNDFEMIIFNESNQEIINSSEINITPSYVVLEAEVDEVNLEKRESIGASQIDKNMETNNYNQLLINTARIGSPTRVADLTLTESQLLEAKTCKICKDSEVKIVYLPCCHLITCVQCSETEVTCLVCRRNIESKLEMRL